ncbi:MAG: metal-dependent hydrolase [Mariniblastus sp.]
MTIAIAKFAERSRHSSISKEGEIAPDESHESPSVKSSFEDGPKSFPRWALGLGSIAPDIPLYFLTFGGLFYFRWCLGWPIKETANHLFKNLFYNDPGWLASHNFLHSPTMLLILVGICWSIRTQFPRLSRWGLFFLAACTLHSVVDILTHNDDGPLMFFPFNWTYRFSSPVSYWDPDHYGKPFMVFEGLFSLILTSVLLYLWWRRKPKRKNDA